MPFQKFDDITKEELDFHVEFYKKHSVHSKETETKEVKNMSKLWEVDKYWKTPEVSISVEELVDITMSLTEAVKKWKNLTEMVVGLIKEADISESVFVYVNDKEIEPENAEKVPVSSIRKLVITTTKIDEKKKMPASKTLSEKMEEEDIKEEDIPKIPKGKVTTKSHLHSGISGYHLKTDVHKNPDAKKAHDKITKQEV